MDSSGCYHFNLFAFLCSEGMICVVINPLLISNFARLSLRKTKTDKKDTLTIAQFLLANGSKLSQVSYSQNSQDLKDLARERESLAVMITGLGNDVRRLHITKDFVSRFSGDNGSKRKKPLLLMLCTYFLFLYLQKKLGRIMVDWLPLRNDSQLSPIWSLNLSFVF